MLLHFSLTRFTTIKSSIIARVGSIHPPISVRAYSAPTLRSWSTFTFYFLHCTVILNINHSTTSLGITFYFLLCTRTVILNSFHCLTRIIHPSQLSYLTPLSLPSPSLPSVSPHAPQSSGHPYRSVMQSTRASSLLPSALSRGLVVVFDQLVVHVPFRAWSRDRSCA